MGLSDLESAILNGGNTGAVVDLSSLKKAPAIKTSEEIRAEQLKERLGKFTASEFHRLVASPSKTDLPTGAVTYSTEKAVEMLTDFDGEGYISFDMQWGMDNEVDAVELFMEETGLAVENIGSKQVFLTMGENIGGTPDGTIGAASGIEIKCPNSMTHFKYMGIKNTEDLKTIMPNYYWQIQGLMMITRSAYWYFISYDPRYKKKEHRLHFVKILRSEDDQWLLRVRLKMAVALRDELLQGFIRVNDARLTQSEVLNLVGFKRTKLFGLRKSGQFPAPVSEVPLLWSAREIENYILENKG